METVRWGGGGDSQTSLVLQINQTLWESVAAGWRLDHKLCLVFHNVPQCTNDPLRDSGMILWDSCVASVSECVHMYTHTRHIQKPQPRTSHMLKSKSVSCNNERMLTNKTTKIKIRTNRLLVFFDSSDSNPNVDLEGRDHRRRAWLDWLCVSALVKQMGEYVCNDHIIWNMLNWSENVPLNSTQP